MWLRSSSMLRAVRIALALLALCSTFLRCGFGQEEPTDGGNQRKIVNRVVPIYPDLARRIQLKGTVRVEVVVAPGAKVASARVLGGNPLLADSAVNSIRKWKYAALPKETTQIVELRFDPN